MEATRARQTESAAEDDLCEEVYDLPVPARCRFARDNQFCRYVPFMPCYDSQHITAPLKRSLCRAASRRRPVDSHPIT